MGMWSPGKTPCAICGKPVMDESDFISFTCLGTLPKAYDSLDDGIAHQTCLSKWEHRDDFVKHWNMAVRFSAFDQKRHLLIVVADIVKYKTE